MPRRGAPRRAPWISLSWRRPWAALPAVLLALQPLAAPAQSQAADSAKGSPADAGDQLIATVRANGVQRGEFTLLRSPDGDFWVLEEDVQRLKLQPPATARREHDGSRYVSMRALGASALTFDEAQLEVRVDFPVQQMEGSRIDMASRPAAALTSPAGTSLVLSYRLGLRHADPGEGTQAVLDNSLALRMGGLLLRQDTRLDTRAPRRFTRGVTQLVWDHQPSAHRIVAGDVLSSAGPFGTAMTGGGLQVLKLYDLAPDVIRHPTATIRTSAALPAQVEVAVDGTTISRTTVGPGPVAVENLLLTGGSRTVRVTVTDASGRREVIEQPFLFTDSVLAEGFHEYAYFAGKRSDLGHDNVIRYEEAAWQGYHRYGLTDSITVAAGGEGSRDFTNAGAGIALRSDRLGLLAFDLLGSHDRGAGRRARGWSARYTYATPRASFFAGHRAFGDGFRSFTTSSAFPFPRSETRVGAATQLFASTVSADVVRTRTEAETRRTVTARLTSNLSRRLSVSGEYQTTRVNGEQAWAVNVFLRLTLDSDRWAGTTARFASDSRQLDVETGKHLAQGVGFGYRVGTSVISQQGMESANAYASAIWNARSATLEAFGSAPIRGGGPTYAEVAASGALLGIDGEWGMARKVHDSFVLARLGVPLPGIEVFLNHQLQGTTDEEGKLFVPDLSAFGRQDVSINDQQVPMQYNLARRRHTVIPAYRSGTVVDFGGTRVRAVAGMAWQASGGQRVRIASRAWTLQGPAGKLSVETGMAGDFYLENAPPGTYAGSLSMGNRVLSCRLVVPEFEDVVHELKEGIVCE